MESHRALLVGLGLVIFGSDLWQDLSAGLNTAQGASAGVRNLLLLLALVTLLKPTRWLVTLSLLACLLALVRRMIFLHPLLPSLLPNSTEWMCLHSGLDLAFRLILLGWLIHWLLKPKEPS